MSEMLTDDFPVLEPEDRLSSLRIMLKQAPVRRPRRSLATRIGSANRALSSLRVSERAERQLLQIAQERLRQYTTAANDGAGAAITAAHAELKLEIQTHLSNLQVIESQITLVRMAIQHLHRRGKGFAFHAGNEFDHRDNGDGSKIIRAGIAAVRALRSLRTGVSAASAKV